RPLRPARPCARVRAARPPRAADDPAADAPVAPLDAPGLGPPLATLAGSHPMSEIYDLYSQGCAHLERGDAAQALVSLERAKTRAPDKASIRGRLGIASFRLGRFDEAETEFRALLDIQPNDDYGHYALGRCLEKRGAAREANGHYKLASSLRPASRQYR